MNSTAKVRFALIGAGVIGDVHARALTQLDTADLVAIADLDESKASIMAQKYGIEEATIDVENLLRRGDIDAVTICTPSGVHADLAVAALNAGKHVVVEKPIDVSLEAADRIVAAEETSGKIVAVISQHRFDKSTEKVTQAVRDGNLASGFHVAGSDYGV
jgi:predicted dehydrogenase